MRPIRTTSEHKKVANSKFKNGARFESAKTKFLDRRGRPFAIPSLCSARKAGHDLPTRGKSHPISSPMDHVGRAEVRSARRPVWQRPLPTLPSVNVFRKDRSLTNDLPARLVIFHSRPGAPPSREARSPAYQKAGGYQDHWRPRVRKSKCAAQFRRPGNTSLMEPICLVENKRSALGSNFSLRGPHWVRRICLQN